jgi:chromosome segregation ATPase
MTVEEMQAMIEGILSAQSGMQREMQAILAVQRDLQEGQIRLQHSVSETTRSVNRLVGYSIDHETDLVSMRDELTSLKTRVEQLENRSN